jgi:hypothetical protein
MSLELKDIFPMEFTTLELEDRDTVPYADLIVVRPPVYVCTVEDFIKNPYTNGELLFNYLLKIAFCVKDEPPVIRDGIKYFEHFFAHDHNKIGSKVREVSIKSKYFVSLLINTGIYDECVVNGVMGELGSLLSSMEPKKVDFNKSRRNSFFIVRVAI